MKTLVTRLFVTTIVATCVLAPAQVSGQEPMTSRPRVDFRFNAGQPASLPSPLLTAARPTAARTPAVPRRKMSAGQKIFMFAAIGLGIGITCAAIASKMGG